MKIRSLMSAPVGALSILLLLGGVSMSAIVSAQTAPKTQPTNQQSEWIQVTTIRVKPEMVPEFIKLAKETIPAHRKAGVEWRDFWVTDIFGDYSEYTVVTPFEKFAEYDAGSPLERGFDKTSFEAWRNKIRHVVENVSSEAVRTRPDLGFGQMTEQPKLAVSFTTRVAPGREQEYETYLKNDYLPVIKRSGVKALYVGQILFGGTVNEYIGVALIDDFADIDKGPPIRRVLNQADTEKLMKKLSPGIVVGQTRSICRYLPELSYMPANTETSSKNK